ncbi:DUF6011 domain-containing protein [Thioalkalivibrio paradoxus]|uniref:Uncharacterized protein n=1 Tax=Thioalkalivibrio paradoxus ARh 1 TaxID=713585 RepID=W0DTS7_9GAMM|nr:DUF6011 domain-containing protein [Thioalkalivibrio paradoxus]AHF00271.1 hypothetical protein THITH_15125 [Thioalkalivibrio paradoxus ARh 1]
MRTATLKSKAVTAWDERNLASLKPQDFEPLPDLTDEESAEMDREFLASATEAQQEQADDLRARGYTVTPGPVEWISPIEQWVSRLLCWEIPGSSDDASEPMGARKVALTLDLPGGSPKDAIKVSIETKVVQEVDRDGRTTWHESLDTVSLTVYADGQSYLGFVECTCVCEMGHTLIALQRDPSPEIGQRVLRVLLDIDGDAPDWPAPLYAALKPLNKCQACGRKLDDPVSRVLQLGPTCANNLGLAHSQRVVEAVMRYCRARGLL